ncbi:hypothetical protein Tco_0759869 [Tanacetum coccineum]
MASMNTRLNIEKHDENIVQKHGGSKQEAQGNRKAEVFQVSNDDTAVAQRWLEDKQSKEKTNTDCLVKEQEKEYQTGWKIKTVIQQQNGLVKETNVTLLAKVRCFLIQSGPSKVFWAEDTTMSIYLVNRSPSSAIRCKKPIDMLGGVLVGLLVLGKGCLNWLRNMGFNESGEYKKTFIGSGVAREREQHLAYELFRYKEDSNKDASATVAGNAVTTTIDITESIHHAEICVTKGLLVEAKGNVLGFEIIRDQSGAVMRKRMVKRIKNGAKTVRFNQECLIFKIKMKL